MQNLREKIFAAYFYHVVLWDSFGDANYKRNLVFDAFEDGVGSVRGRDKNQRDIGIDGGFCLRASMVV